MSCASWRVAGSSTCSCRDNDHRMEDLQPTEACLNLICFAFKFKIWLHVRSFAWRTFSTLLLVSIGLLLACMYKQHRTANTSKIYHVVEEPMVFFLLLGNQTLSFLCCCRLHLDPEKLLQLSWSLMRGKMILIC
jgi:hypothetical protein